MADHVLTVSIPREDANAADRWRVAAQAEGMTLSAWVRRALDRQADAERRRAQRTAGA